ncbi:Uncharacterized protein OS=Singulisphaera acidiphila (strain ATCC BAA-1392 / DSM 18658 / VKM B-2454 / MOB10) GN=Sinac_1598 PE=4 SV=1 [Gemmata massiliana]|uniref:PEP-CTERM protein-sorting domain-containing protein n=1 Tax=Gemmata massiliana TaxID=1210884 RepID=A0A6P2CPQ4_9BACT|nr:hypothetical protein [Gemmata massiliana]VTR90998.1 Uncharacterized protein OS=Singulisphaera acidiphila (strain ATCC BAA-1392 / DSM 18658 / VKM B-2454 / MOB10) GN=Sinac_1598 PE=4 SV=1 [Gemmata massiliana]
MLSRSVRPIRSLAIAGLMLLASAGSARADLISFTGGGSAAHPSSYSGSIEVKNQTTTSAVIEVKLTNTSTNAFNSSAANGFITGFAFNNPGTAAKGNITGVTSFSASYNPATGQAFQLVNATPSSNLNLGSLFGKFDFAASVGSTLHTSGTASNGLSVGETGTFTFVVSGTNLTNLTAANLLSELSTGGSQDTPFVVRFRGYNTPKLPYGGDGDKVPLGSITTPPCPPNGVPAPPGLVLAGMGAGCLMLGRLRRKPALV